MKKKKKKKSTFAMVDNDDSVLKTLGYFWSINNTLLFFLLFCKQLLQNKTQGENV